MHRKNVLEMTERERDVWDCMLEAAEEVLDSRKRVCLPPAEIRNKLAAKHPGIKVHNVVDSQKNLESMELITRIHDPRRNEPLDGKRPVSSFELNERLYAHSEVRLITKRKSGYKAGTYKKPAANPADRAKTVVKKARGLLDRKRTKFKQLGERNMRDRKRLEKQEAELGELREEIQTLAELLALSERNLKRAGLFSKSTEEKV